MECFPFGQKYLQKQVVSFEAALKRRKILWFCHMSYSRALCAQSWREVQAIELEQFGAAICSCARDCESLVFRALERRVVR